MSTNTKVNVDVLSVNTKKAQNEFKSLKTKIKELRLELENLDEGTAEYQAKITELGNLMHQNTEIQEQAKLASQDYGDTIASVTKATTGLVASISAVNGVMNLLGVNSDEATKAMLKVQSLMAIVQAMGSLDTAEKSFQSLWTKIKAVTSARKENVIETQKDTITTNQNTNAVNTNAEALDTQSKTLSKGTSGLKLFGSGIKSLGRSLKSFALSNPFTLIITGITTAISLISTFINKAKQAQLEAEKANTETMKKFYSGVTTYNDIDLSDGTISRELAQIKYSIKTTKEEVENILNLKQELDDYRLTDLDTFKGLKNEYEFLKEEIEILEHYWSYKTREEKNSLEGLNERKKILEKYSELYSKEQTLLIDNIYLLTKRALEYDKESELYEEVVNKINTLQESLENSYNSAVTNYKSIEEIIKGEKTLLDKQNEEAQQERDKRQQKALNDLKDSLSEQKQQLDLDYKKKLISEKEYLDKSLELNKWYENKLNELKGNKYVTKSEKLSAQNNTADSEIKQLEYEILQIRNRFINEPDEILLNEKARLEQNINSLTELIKQNNAKLDDISNKHWIEQYNTLQQQNDATEEEQIAHLDKMLGIEQSYLEEQLNVLRTNYDNRKQYLTDIFNRDNEALQLELEQLQKNNVNEQYILDKQNEITILAETHYKQLAELENQYLLNKTDIELQKTEIEADYSNQRYEIARNEIERKIALNETYFNSFQTIQSQLSSFLSEYQNSMDSNSEKYKELQRLQIIMDSASGSYSAFTSAFKSGVPFPYNIILGGLASSLVVGQGVLTLNNLNNNKIGTTNAVSNLGNNRSTYETLSYQSLNGIETSIRDSRVYVLESDITNVRNRVEIAEMESRF